MARLACLYIDAFPLQLLLLRESLDGARQAVAVLERDHPRGRVTWVNEPARSGGVLPGMRYAEALSLLAGLRAGVVAEAEIGAASEALLGRLHRFSPTIEPAPEVPGLFWLDIRGLGGVFASARAWAHELRGALREARLRATLVLGWRRFASYAVATGAPGSLLIFDSPQAELERACQVPLSRLDLDPKLRERLERLGVRTPGELTRLPEHGLRERFGPQAARLHRLARGLGTIPLHNAEEASQPRLYRELMQPVERIEQLVFVIKGMLPGLFAQLTARGEVLVELGLRFELDHAPDCLARVRPAEPTLDQMQLVDLVRLKLESLDLGAPVIGLELAAAGQDARPEQLGLFAEKPRRDLAAANRALARVRAELGPDAVVRATLRQGHLPEARCAFEPLVELVAPKPRPDCPRVLVRRLLVHPIALTAPTRLVRNDGWTLASPLMGSVVRSIGPYIVSGGWWHAEVHRSYHFVETQDGTLLWVFLDRRRRRWFLHGIIE